MFNKILVWFHPFPVHFFSWYILWLVIVLYPTNLCKVDVAFHDRNHVTSFSCCVRDSRGQFIRAQTKRQRTNITVLEGEAVALLKAFHFVDANRWDRVVFESDSSTLVQALSSSGHGDSEFYVIVSSINYKLSLHSNFKVKFVSRQANMAAHTLASVTP